MYFAAIGVPIISVALIAASAVGFFLFFRFFYNKKIEEKNNETSSITHPSDQPSAVQVSHNQPSSNDEQDDGGNQLPSFAAV